MPSPERFYFSWSNSSQPSTSVNKLLGLCLKGASCYSSNMPFLLLSAFPSVGKLPSPPSPVEKKHSFFKPIPNATFCKKTSPIPFMVHHFLKLDVCFFYLFIPRLHYASLTPLILSCIELRLDHAPPKPVTSL